MRVFRRQELSFRAEDDDQRTASRLHPFLGRLNELGLFVSLVRISRVAAYRSAATLPKAWAAPSEDGWANVAFEHASGRRAAGPPRSPNRPGPKRAPRFPPGSGPDNRCVGGFARASGRAAIHTVAAIWRSKPMYAGLPVPGAASRPPGGTSKRIKAASSHASDALPGASALPRSVSRSHPWSGAMRIAPPRGGPVAIPDPRSQPA